MICLIGGLRLKHSFVLQIASHVPSFPLMSPLGETCGQLRSSGCCVSEWGSVQPRVCNQPAPERRTLWGLLANTLTEHLGGAGGGPGICISHKCSRWCLYTGEFEDPHPRRPPGLPFSTQLLSPHCGKDPVAASSRLPW